LAELAARVAQLDPAALVRLRADGKRVVALATTPFEVLATREVRGELVPTDLTVPASELLAALAVLRQPEVDPGSPADGRWRAELPPGQGWRAVAEVAAVDLAALAADGLAEARAARDLATASHDSGTPLPPAELLDRAAYRMVLDGDGPRVVIPFRCLFALAGLGLLDGGGAVRVELTPDRGWLRLSTSGGAIVRRLRVLLPLV
jgi:hypothetical protein